MSLCRDKQVKGFLLFLLSFALLLLSVGTIFAIYQVNNVETLWLTHDEAVASSLLEQGVSKETIAAGGIVHITWDRTPAMFRILISDNGTGIAPEDIHHIFKRFYRSQHSLDTQGIGLGLPLAKSIIEGQGGIISVQSEIGNGTTFTLSFLTEL